MGYFPFACGEAGFSFEEAEAAGYRHGYTRYNDIGIWRFGEQLEYNRW